MEDLLNSSAEYKRNEELSKVSENTYNELANIKNPTPSQKVDITKAKKTKDYFQNKYAESSVKLTKEIKRFIETTVTDANEYFRAKDPNHTPINIKEINIGDIGGDGDKLSKSQKKFNEYMTTTLTTPLKEKLRNVFPREIMSQLEKADNRWAIQKLVSHLGESNYLKYTVYGAGSLSTIYITLQFLYQMGNKDQGIFQQSLKDFASTKDGCYQIDMKNNVVVGPCECGFKKNQIYTNVCSQTTTEDLDKQVGNLNFCRTDINNRNIPCDYTVQACSEYTDTALGGSCKIGQCDSVCDTDPTCKSCQKDDPTCQWKAENNNIKSYPLCINPDDILLTLLDLNDNSDQWVPTPTPPLIILLSILGVILLMLTFIWYILFLIRKERKMLK